MNLNGRHFLLEADFTPAEWRGLIDLAAELKAAKKAGREERRLVGRNIAGTDYSVDIVMAWGAGAYIVGEETALIESIVLGDGGRRHVEALRALVEAGANTQLADRDGATPLALAKTRGYEAMVEILRKAGAR